jgi:hypothetical protein
MYVCIHACMYVRIKNHISIHITYNQATYDAATYVSKYVSMYVCIHACVKKHLSHHIALHLDTAYLIPINNIYLSHHITYDQQRSIPIAHYRLIPAAGQLLSVTIKKTFITSHYVRSATLDSHRSLSVDTSCWSVTISYYQSLPFDISYRCTLGVHFAMHHVSYYPLHQLCTTIRY